MKNNNQPDYFKVTIAKIILMSLIFANVSFGIEIPESISKYTDEISETMEENENSDEGKAYQEDYANKEKQAKKQNKENRKKRIACLGCPNSQTVKTLFLNLIEQELSYEDYNFYRNEFTNIRFYNAIHFNKKNDKLIPSLERKYGINQYDTVDFDPNSIAGFKNIFSISSRKEKCILNYYPERKAIFYKSGKYFFKIEIYPERYHRDHEFALYENTLYSPINDADLSDEEFELPTNISYKNDTSFFNGQLNLEAEMYVDTELYKGVVSYNWRKEHFGNFVYQGDNSSRYSSYSTNFGTDDNFSIGLKAILVNKNNLNEKDFEDLSLVKENTYSIEANYSF